MKQPKVPEYSGEGGAETFIRTLVLFLKDFCHEAWRESLKQGRMTKEMLQQVYPIGSIYLSAKEESPQAMFGGVWERAETTLEMNMWKRTG